jgi:TonB-linked SusC/RagA family outer membrane protein
MRNDLRGKKRLFRRLWSILLITGIVSVSFAQVRTVTGTVTAADTKETLPGATIVVKGTISGTTTDINGKYSLKLMPGKVILIFSFVGYSAREVEVKDLTVVDVELQPINISLGEVVVVGYGTVRKSDLTGSVATVKTDELTKITTMNPIEALEGKVAGVQISNISGTPGESPIVRIRGVGTFNNSDPIYVVDGVILYDISFLNSADIASIEVLKDASATAMYGNRGANGVIIITTKTGNIKEGKTAFNITGETGLQTVAHKIGLLTGKEFAIVSNEISPGSYNNVEAVNNTDWQNLIFKVAPLYNFQISTSGASKNTQFYVSLGYFGQEGIIDKSYFRRITIKFDNAYNLTNFLKLGHNLTFTPSMQGIAPNVTYQAYRANPVLEPYNPDGTYAPIPGVGNPLANLNYSNNTNKGIRAVGNLFAEVNFLKSFTFKTSYGIDAGYTKGVNFTPAYFVSPQQYNIYNLLAKAYSDNLTWLWENTLTFAKDIGKHSINVVGGYTMQNSSSELVNLTGQNIIRDGSNLWYIQGINVYDASNKINNLGNQFFKNNVDPNLYYSMISYLFRANYTFNHCYILTVTYRRDGSSKFSPSNRYGDFPSVALGWNISEERFMKNLKFLSKLKIRGSWGQVGNEKINYYDQYSVVNSNIVTVLGTPPTANPGASFGPIGNPNLKWEVTTQTDAGLETSLFKDRLTGEFDYFNKVTDKVLVDLSIPGYFGNGEGTQERFNAAKVLNRGFEFNLSWRDQIGKVKYSLGANGTVLHNEVLSIGGVGGSDTVLFGGYLSNGLATTASRIGLPIGAFYGYKTDGLFQTQAELNAYPHLSGAGVGDLKFLDMNGDGKLDGRDRTYLGSPIPKFIFGFNFALEYKGIDLSVDFQGQTGNKIFNAKEVVRPDKYNFESHVLGAWTGQGTSYTEPKASFGGYNYNISDFFIQDGSFLRIRDIVVGYTLPAAVSKTLYMQKCRIYFKADNLYTWTKFTGYSPEIGSGDVLSAGIDFGAYPITAVYSFGLNFNF